MIQKLEKYNQMLTKKYIKMKKKKWKKYGYKRKKKKKKKRILDKKFKNI